MNEKKLTVKALVTNRFERYCWRILYDFHGGFFF